MIRGGKCLLSEGVNGGIRDDPESIPYYYFWDQEPIFITTEEEIAKEKKEKRKKTLQKSLAVAVAAVFIFANVIFFTASYEEPIKDEPHGYNIEMVTPNVIEYEFSGEFPATDIRDLRGIIDSRGDGNGIVSEEEVKKYETYCIEEADHSYTSEFRINGSRGRYLRYDLKLGKATGDVDSERPMLVYFSYKIMWSSIEKNASSYHIYKSNYFNLEFDFKFQSPPGYIIKETSGLKYPNYNSDATIVSGFSDGDKNGVDVYIIKLL